MSTTGGTLRLGVPLSRKRRPGQPRTDFMRPARSPWLGRVLVRPQPTVYQRCLAIHIYYAGPRSALS
jgi:hypothetical protein